MIVFAVRNIVIGHEDAGTTSRHDAYGVERGDCTELRNQSVSLSEIEAVNWLSWRWSRSSGHHEVWFGFDVSAF